MTIGEHLDELRVRVVRSLLALLAACIVCIWPAKYLLEIIARPVVLALRRHGQAESFLATAPAEVLLLYMKVVLIAGLILAAPYVLYQIWGFIAAGLYQNERAWVHRLLPWSVGLFVAGVAFMYAFVLIVSLNFLIGFNNWLPLPSPEPTALEAAVLRTPDLAIPATQPGIADAPQVPFYRGDPPNPPVGAVWVNVVEKKLKVRWPEATYSHQLQRDDKRGLAETHLKIGEYLSFVLMMTIAFGLAFQMPLVVVFLIRSGIVPAQTLRKYRRVVILIIVVIAGILAPPDLLSHLLLSGPMILLYEIGLWVGARGGRKAAAA